MDGGQKRHTNQNIFRVAKPNCNRFAVKSSVFIAKCLKRYIISRTAWRCYQGRVRERAGYQIITESVWGRRAQRPRSFSPPKTNLTQIHFWQPRCCCAVLLPLHVKVMYVGTKDSPKIFENTRDMQGLLVSWDPYVNLSFSHWVCYWLCRSPVSSSPFRLCHLRMQLYLYTVHEQWTCIYKPR